MTTKLATVIADFTTQLTTVLAVGGTTATLASATDDDGVALPAGIYFFTIDGANSQKEHIVCTLSGTSLTAISSTSRQGVQTSGAARLHRVGATVTITDFAHLLFVNQLLLGTIGLDSSNPIFYTASFTPTLGQYQVPTWDYVKAYADALVSSGAPYGSSTVFGLGRAYSSTSKSLGTATMTIASPCVVSKTAHGLILNDSVVFTNSGGALPTGITAGATYYVISAGLTTDAFQIAATIGGTAINTSGSQSGTHTLFRTSPVFMNENDSRIPTASQVLAAAGTSGTPGSTNPFVTENDTSNAATKTATTIAFANPYSITDSGNGFVTAGFRAGQTISVSGTASNNGDFTISAVAAGTLTVVETVTNEAAGPTVVIAAAKANKAIRFNGSGQYPAGDGSLLTGIAGISDSYTADGGIAANDTVYPTSAGSTVKTIYPTAQGTGAAVTTAASHTNSAVRMFPLAANGLVIRFTGGDRDNSSALYGQVRTLNAAETDFSNGTEANIYTTGNGCRDYDVAPLGGDKFLIIFQADTAGAAAGIKTVVVSVSGTTITVGSIVTIETTGGFSQTNSVAQLDTDKGLIVYTKDSDGDIYTQVLTVSGTTISTNTAALVKAVASTSRMRATQISTNKAIVIYASSSDLFGRIIDVSGTTPTVQTENTIATGATSWMMGILKISTTKALVLYGDDGGGAFNDRAVNVAISGSTLTASSTINLAAARITRYYGNVAISEKYALVSDMGSTSSVTLWLLDVSGTAPVSVSSQNLSMGVTSGLYHGLGLAKVSPWTYVSDNIQSDGDYIVKLTPSATAITRIGLAQSDIANAASGVIFRRYLPQTLTGITLTPGSAYYVNDNGQPTTSSSLTAPTLGVAISTSKLFIE